MAEHIKELLESSRGILLDSSAILSLHSDEYRRLLPLILGKLKVYTTFLAVIEVLTFLYYRKLVNVQDDVLDALFKLYQTVPFTPRLLSKAAQIYADLLQHNYVPEIVDVVNVSAAIQENLVLVSASVQNYKVFEKYGLALLDLEDFVTALERLL